MRKALNGTFEMMNVKNTVDNEYGNIPEKFKMIPIYDKRRDKRKCTLDTRSVWEKGIFLLAMQGKIEGKPPRGRRWMEMITSGFVKQRMKDVIDAARRREI